MSHLGLEWTRRKRSLALTVSVSWTLSYEFHIYSVELEDWRMGLDLGQNVRHPPDLHLQLCRLISPLIILEQ